MRIPQDNISRIEPLDIDCGASLPPLRHEVGERDGERWCQGTWGEAFLHEINGVRGKRAQ